MDIKDPQILFNLGGMYLNGQDGMQQSDEKAFECFKEAAERGNAQAQLNLGVMYENGRGVEQSDEQAVECFKEAAEGGNAQAQLNLGVMYFNGRGVEQNYEKAVECFKKAAERGNAQAQCNLGVMYENGRGVEQSDEQAVECFKEAAEGGNAQAQLNLGVMYFNGRGVEQNYEKAVECFKEAAERGNAQAQLNLDAMSRKKQGIAQDREQGSVLKNEKKEKDQNHSSNIERAGDLGTDDGLNISATQGANNHQQLVGEVPRIKSDPEIIEVLERVGILKLIFLYKSICSLELTEENMPLVTVGVWTFFESMSGSDECEGKDFLKLFKNRAAEYCKIANEKATEKAIKENAKAIGEAIERIHRDGNITKHHKTSANLSHNQMIMDMQTLKDLIIGCLKNIEEKNRKSENRHAH